MTSGRGLVLGWGPPEQQDAPFLERLWPAVLDGAVKGRGLSVNVDVLNAVLADSARDCLNTRRRRDELVAALSPVVDAADDPVVAANEVVEAALEYHTKQLAGNGGVCRLGKFHNVLYVAATVAATHEAQDSGVVAALISALHSCEGGLDRLIGPALLGPRISRLLSASQPDVDTLQEAHSRLEYFLGHARAVHLTLPQPGGPPLSMLEAPLPTLQGAGPLYTAVQSGEEATVLLLLQHGAKPVLGGQFCPLLLAITRLSTYTRATLSQCPPCSCPFYPCVCLLSYPIDYPPQDIAVLRLLLRAAGGYCLPDHPELLHPRLLIDCVLPSEPPRLTHWARYSLRTALSDAWALPKGTATLSLPTTMLPFMDLVTD